MYRVKFKSGATIHEVQLESSEELKTAMTEGIYVDEKFDKVENLNDILFIIMPHMITLVEKL